MNRNSITTLEDFIKTYEVFEGIQKLKELNLVVGETDHYEGMVIDLLDFLGTMTMEMEYDLLRRKPEYIATAVIRSDLLKALTEYQRGDYDQDE